MLFSRRNLVSLVAMSVISIRHTELFMYPRVVRGCIQKFPDWVDNEIYACNNKLALRINTKGYGDKTH
jgi:hypothetical protein